MSQADIKEEILDDCLNHGKYCDRLQGILSGTQDFSGCDASDEQGQDSGQGETDAGKENLTGCVPG